MRAALVVMVLKVKIGAEFIYLDGNGAMVNMNATELLCLLFAYRFVYVFGIKCMSANNWQIWHHHLPAR